MTTSHTDRYRLTILKRLKELNWVEYCEYNFKHPIYNNIDIHVNTYGCFNIAINNITYTWLDPMTINILIISNEELVEAILCTLFDYNL